MLVGGKRHDLALAGGKTRGLGAIFVAKREPAGEGGRRPAPPWNLPSFLHLQIAPHLLPHLSHEDIAPPPPLRATTCGRTSAAAAPARGRDGAAILQRHPPAAHGSTAAATPVPSEMPATTTKKADAAQPPHGRAPVQSPAAQSAPASVRTAASHGAMDGAQQVVEESPTGFVLYIVTSFCNSV